MKYSLHISHYRPAALVILFLIVIQACTACSSQQVNRALYGTLGNIGDQQCSKETLTYCQQPQNYETYRKERKQAIDAQN